MQFRHPALVVRAHNVPRRLGRVGDLQHAVARPRVVVPAPPRFQVGGTQLPLPQGILNTRFEARPCVSFWMCHCRLLCLPYPFLPPHIATS
jgi:hypothetical protein